MNEQLVLFTPPERALEKNLSENDGGKPRLNSPIRNQIEMVHSSLDDLLAKDHIVRSIWQFVQGMNLSAALKKIKSVRNAPGRSATDPKILLALWLLATIKGISSARMIEEYCSEHDAFRWICGGVNVNYHTISDFRAQQGELFDNLLTQTVAVLAHKKIISLETVSQDGMRVRANAGTSSFKREETLQANLQLASMLVADLKEEAIKNPGACKARIEAAQKKAANETAKNLKEALEELEEVRKGTLASRKHSAQVKEERILKARASTTDPEARVMKMACGGFRPAYNIQYATTNIGKAIIGVNVAKTGSDQKQTLPMIKQVEKRYGRVPKKWLQDGGYVHYEELHTLGRKYEECEIYMPVKDNFANEADRYKRSPKDNEISGEWRERMGTEEAKEIYKERASTAEYVNAVVRNQGFQQLLVRGANKVLNVALIYAITHNMTLVIKNWV